MYVKFCELSLNVSCIFSNVHLVFINRLTSFLLETFPGLVAEGECNNAMLPYLFTKHLLKLSHDVWCVIYEPGTRHDRNTKNDQVGLAFNIT